MISMLSFNVRIQSRWDGANAFVHRRDAIVRTLHTERPDVVGFQEMMPEMLDYFKENLQGYAFIGQCGKSGKKGEKGEYTAIAYRTDTLALEESETFWLSPTPWRKGSRFLLQSLDARTCTRGTFRHRETGTRFRYFNTHLDHLSPPARSRGIRVILKAMAACQLRERLPLFWGGDFNFTPKGALYAYCLQQIVAGQPLVDLTDTIEATFNWFGALKRPIKLDYILTDRHTSRDHFALRVLQTDGDGRYLSDHNALRIDWTPQTHWGTGTIAAALANA